MPLRTDDLECKISCAQLCDTVERGDALIVGEQYSNLTMLLRIFADIFIDVAALQSQQQQTNGGAAAGSATPECYSEGTLSRMQSIVKQVVGSAAEAVNRLSAEQQQALRMVC
jgi:hypothetical protein